jgi:purine-binding chemotaxis protein CheW
MDLVEKKKSASLTDEQVVIFTLHNELFGLDISRVNEISELLPMNLVPKAPEFIKGVINYHGRIVAIHDLASFFDLPANTDDNLARIIVLVPGEYHIAFLVHSVKEIIFVPETVEEVNPMEGEDFKNIYIEKVVCIGENPVNIIDVGKLLADLEDYFKEVNIEH